jgi:hypothetical protein
MAKIVVPTAGGAQFWADRRYRDGWRVQENVVTGHHRLLDAANRRHAFGSLELCLDHLSELELEPAPPDVVVMLHGLGRTRRSLLKLGQKLESAGHHTIALDYPSTRRSLDAHVEQVVQVLEHLEGAQRVSFVTHSLGGIITRGVLASASWPQRLEVGRVVMIAPPNRGAALARILGDKVPKLFGAAMGPSAFEIANGPPYPEPSVPVMVVAGRPRDGGLNPLLEGDDDGVVRVEETKLETMAEHLVVDAIHTLVMDHPDTTSAAIRFLEPVPPTR